jgi:hypothetical protein
MAATSGTFPYDLQGPVPFITPATYGGDAIGMSGILFEQYMFVALAEWRRYRQYTTQTHDPFRFKNYTFISGVPVPNPYPADIYQFSTNIYDFEPKSDGSTIENSGNLGTTNWSLRS